MGTGRKKIEIKKINKKSALNVAFSKRRQGIFRKAQQFHLLTGASIAVVVFSPTGRPYSYGGPSIDAVIERYLQTSVEIDNNGNENGNENENETENEGGWRGLLNVNVEGCNEVGELMRMKEKLEEFRERAAERLTHLEEDLFVDSLFC